MKTNIYFAQTILWQASLNHVMFPYVSTPRRRCEQETGTFVMNQDMEMMLKGYGLTTAEIFYRMPDHPVVLQTYVWQQYDLAPDFPEMNGFLKFWQEKLDGPLHSVRYVHRKMISASEWRALKGEFILH
jgi:uncharacterized protein Usg